MPRELITLARAPERRSVIPADDWLEGPIYPVEPSMACYRDDACKLAIKGILAAFAISLTAVIGIAGFALWWISSVAEKQADTIARMVEASHASGDDIAMGARIFIGIIVTVGILGGIGFFVSR